MTYIAERIDSRAMLCKSVSVASFEHKEYILGLNQQTKPADIEPLNLRGSFDEPRMRPKKWDIDNHQNTPDDEKEVIPSQCELGAKLFAAVDFVDHADGGG